MELLELFISSILNNNIALAFILGMCPLIAISTSVKNANGMGIAVVLVVTLTAIINYPIYQLLKATGTQSLMLLVFMIVIAATVQFLEIFVEKYLPDLYNSFGIFLPLITVNCIVLAVSQFFVIREYTFAQTATFSFASGLGWWLAIVLLAGVRQRLFINSDVPRGLVGKGIVFVILGILSLAFFGFTGLNFF
jgi:Na+-transporting NADH:ubiquinone oxidoreductase subunit E